jgi:broad specificity phosphatase PhoE
VQSTEEIKKVFPDVPVFYTEDLQEGDLGGLIGKKQAYQNELGDFYSAKECKDMNIERPESIVERGVRVVKNCLKDYGGKTVFLVGHRDPLEFLTWALFNPNSKIIAPITEIQKDYLIEKGEGKKLVINIDQKVLEYSKAC